MRYRIEWFRRLFSIVPMFFLLSLFNLSPVSAAMINGNDWVQVKDYANVSWYELDQAFDENGYLEASYVPTGSFDFTGLRWASSVEVFDMLLSMTNGTNLVYPFSYDTDITQVNEFMDKFTETGNWTDATQYYNRSYVQGYTRDRDVAGDGYISGKYTAIEVDTYYDGPANGIQTEYYNGNMYAAVGEAYDYRGAFLYRDTPVPVPSTILLLGFGILGLAGIRRNKRS